MLESGRFQTERRFTRSTASGPAPQPAFLSRSLLVDSQAELPHIRALAAALKAKLCLDTPAPMPPPLQHIRIADA
jgi:hypothetical protein